MGENHHSSSTKVLASFASIYLIWGTTYLAIALAIETIPPFISGAGRFLLAGALMYAWLRIKHPQPLANVPIVAALACGVLLSGMGNGFVIWAQQGIPSGIAALMVASLPVSIAVLDWAFFSRTPPTSRALVGIAIGLAGVVTIVLHTRDLSGDVQPMHLLSMLAAVLAWSVGTLKQKQLARAETVLSFTCVQMIGGGLFQLFMATLDDEWSRFDVSAVSMTSAIAVLYLLVFGSLVALNAYLWLLTRVPAQKVTTYALVNPVVALILGAVVLNERLTWLSVIAAALVLTGVGLVLFQNVRLPRWGKRDVAPACPTTPPK